MCYAIPGKVIEINGKKVTVEYFGEKKTALNEFHELKLGDYIYAQGGFVIKLIPEPDALEILSVWRETFFELHELDLRFSKIDHESKGIDKKVTLILDKSLEERPVSKEDLLYLMQSTGDAELSLIGKTANFLRHKYLGNSCCVHGIVEFSNHCSQSCCYCGISSHNKTLRRYRMTKEEIFEAVDQAVEKYGFKALVLQSGEDKYYSIDDLCEIIREIKNKHAVLIFISFGEVGVDGLKKLYDAGARGLLMRFETSNGKIYSDLHPGRTISSRIEHLEAAHKLGYLIITGGLIGLPGQTSEDIVNDILLAKKLNAEMYTFGPFLAHPETPLKDNKPPKTEDVLKALAVCRIADPINAKILVTTGFETLDEKARDLGLQAGANSVMLNVTPDKYKADYSIYPNRAHSNESLEEQIEKTLSILKGLGRAPTDLGVSTL